MADLLTDTAPLPSYAIAVLMGWVVKQLVGFCLGGWAPATRTTVQGLSRQSHGTILSLQPTDSNFLDTDFLMRS